MKLLVSGGAGFIGAAFVRRVLTDARSHEVVTLDKLTYAGDPTNLDDLPNRERHRFVLGDITDADLVESLMEGVDAIDPDLTLRGLVLFHRAVAGPDEA